MTIELKAPLPGHQMCRDGALGVTRMLAPIMRAMMGREMAGHLANLARALETS